MEFVVHIREQITEILITRPNKLTADVKEMPAVDDSQWRLGALFGNKLRAMGMTIRQVTRRDLCEIVGFLLLAVAAKFVVYNPAVAHIKTAESWTTNNTTTATTTATITPATTTVTVTAAMLEDAAQRCLGGFQPKAAWLSDTEIITQRACQLHRSTQAGDPCKDENDNKHVPLRSLYTLLGIPPSERLQIAQQAARGDDDAAAAELKAALRRGTADSSNRQGCVDQGGSSDTGGDSRRTAEGSSCQCSDDTWRYRAESTVLITAARAVYDGVFKEGLQLEAELEKLDTMSGGGGGEIGEKLDMLVRMDKAFSAPCHARRVAPWPTGERP